MPALFTDRQDAGRQLAQRLTFLAGQPGLVVLGLARGGVPVAAEVARVLAAPLNVFVVRKIGVPGHEELAMGAVASGGVRVVNQEVVRAAGVERKVFDAVGEEELHEVARRERAYRQNVPAADLRGATVLLIDDGVATGSTMLAGTLALRQLGPARIVVAAPVMSLEAADLLTRSADQCVAVTEPEPFFGVGRHYREFSETTDAEVRSLLEHQSVPAPRPEESHIGMA